MNTETRPASFDEALREIENGSAPMDVTVMTSLLGDMQIRYARAMSDYKTLRNYALQLNAQCDAQAKRIEELESDLAHADVAVKDNVVSGDQVNVIDQQHATDS